MVLKSNKATVAVRLCALSAALMPLRTSVRRCAGVYVADGAGNAIHKEILRSLKYAIVWVRLSARASMLTAQGSSAKHSRGQKVGPAHVLEDEDVIQVRGPPAEPG